MGRVDGRKRAKRCSVDFLCCNSGALSKKSVRLAASTASKGFPASAASVHTKTAADDARVVKEGLGAQGKPLRDIPSKPMTESLDDMAAASSDEAVARMVLRKDPCCMAAR